MKNNHTLKQLYYSPRTAIEAEILFAARVIQVRFLKRPSGKTSGAAFLFNKQFSLADCCILFTITIKKTKCSTALSAPIFLPLLLCSRGVFPLGRSKNRRCIICAAKKDFCFNRCPGDYLPYFYLLLIYGRNSSCEKESVF